MITPAHAPAPLRDRTGDTLVQGHLRERKRGRLRPSSLLEARAELAGGAPCWREDRRQRGPGLGPEGSAGHLGQAGPVLRGLGF